MSIHCGFQKSSLTHRAELSGSTVHTPVSSFSGCGRFRRLIVQGIACTMSTHWAFQRSSLTPWADFSSFIVHTQCSVSGGIAAFADLSHKAWSAHFDRTSNESPCTKASKYHLHSICCGWRVGIVHSKSHKETPPR